MTETPQWLKPRRPGRSVRRRQMRRVGVFKRQHGTGRTPHTNPERDRSLPGKARRRARREAKRRERIPFFKGHGVASENAYNARYDCPCGRSMVAPLDDFEFMADVMEHEAEHADGAS